MMKRRIAAIPITILGMMTTRVPTLFTSPAAVYLHADSKQQVQVHVHVLIYMYTRFEFTVEPPNRGHFGTTAFVLSSEVVLFSVVV